MGLMPCSLCYSDTVRRDVGCQEFFVYLLFTFCSTEFLFCSCFVHGVALMTLIGFAQVLFWSAGILI